MTHYTRLWFALAVTGLLLVVLGICRFNDSVQIRPAVELPVIAPEGFPIFAEHVAITNNSVDDERFLAIQMAGTPHCPLGGSGFLPDLNGLWTKLHSAHLRQIRLSWNGVHYSSAPHLLDYPAGSSAVV